MRDIVTWCDGCDNPNCEQCSGHSDGTLEKLGIKIDK